MLIGRRSFLAALVLPIAPLRGGRFVGNVPLGRFDGKPAPPFHILLGSGLDARQFTDLSSLNPENLITTNERFFVRTSWTERAPKPGSFAIGGLVVKPEAIPAASLPPLAREMGAHLMECAGNSDPANFGLMSTARWDGIPIGTFLDRVRPQSGPWRVRVTGADDMAGTSRSSDPGASWVFHRDELERSGAFLATGMNGARLPPDHGDPVRLVVPGWYGCACIKWVAAIDIVPDDEPATRQMIEFARRTHQEGIPRLARDYAPPVIDLAAMPVRVEQWSMDGRTVYRVVGIQWGGNKPTRSLSIRFRHNEPFVPVEDCNPPTSAASWSMWSQTWRPSIQRRYRIVLRNDDPSIRSRRLEMFFYTREVDIQRV